VVIWWTTINLEGFSTWLFRYSILRKKKPLLAEELNCFEDVIIWWMQTIEWGRQTKRRLPSPPYLAVRRGASGKAFPNGVWEREIGRPPRFS